MSTGKSENYLRFIALVLCANTRLIILVTVLFSFFAALIYLLYPPVYTVKGSLIVKSKKVPASPEDPESESNSREMLPPTNEDVLMETRIVSNIELIEEAVTRLKAQGIEIEYGSNKGALGALFSAVHKNNAVVEESREGVDSLSGMAEQGNESQKRNREIAMKIKNDLSATVFPGSHIIDVTFTYGDPGTGQKILDQILDYYPTFRLRIFSDEKASNFYSDQVETYRKKMREYNREIIEFLEARGVSDAPQELQGVIRLINDYKKDLENLKDTYQESKRQLAYLERVKKRYSNAAHGDTVVLPPPIDFGEIEGQRRQLYDMLLTQYKEMRKHASQSQAVMERAQRIRNELGNVIAWEKETQQTLNELIYEKQLRIDKLQRHSVKLRKVQLELDKLKSDAQMSKERYKAFSSKLANLEGASEITQRANVQVLSRPSIPGGPSFPKASTVPLGIITGFILSLTIAWLKEFFDHTFKVPSQVTQILDLPVIGSISQRDISEK